ncbi:MAG: hypothetical protein E4G98_00610 [Promethearchaeota archaeon]|nr:MAG: hypothetical protein E4G98_00610 [Candidatus Lokiarchaeota archaeon]
MKFFFQKGTGLPSDLIQILQPADVVFHRTEGSFMGTLITEYTDSPYSHCETYICDGECVSANLPRIVKHKKMFKLWVDVFRWYEDLTLDQQSTIVEESLNHVG